MDSKQPKEKQEEGKVFPRSATNGHEPFQMVAWIKDDRWQKGKVELDDLLRWEDEGGQIANHMDDGKRPHRGVLDQT